MLDDLAISKAADVDDFHRHVLTGGRKWSEGPLVRSVTGQHEGDLVIFGDRVYDLQVDIRKGAAQTRDPLLQPIQVGGGEAPLMFDDIWSEEIIERTQVPFVEPLLDHGSEHLDVVLLFDCTFRHIRFFRVGTDAQYQ